jgi:uncharacterized protein (DUF433 family)
MIEGALGGGVIMPITREATIINRGRGPGIAGTRITAYDVMDYLRHGWHRDRITALFRLSSLDLQAAFDYIAQHRSEVEADYERIRERPRTHTNSPEVQARMAQSRGTARRLRDQLRGVIRGQDDPCRRSWPTTMLRDTFACFWPSGPRLSGQACGRPRFLRGYLV